MMPYDADIDIFVLSPTIFPIPIQPRFMSPPPVAAWLFQRRCFLFFRQNAVTRYDVAAMLASFGDKAPDPLFFAFCFLPPRQRHRHAKASSYTRPSPVAVTISDMIACFITTPHDRPEKLTFQAEEWRERRKRHVVLKNNQATWKRCNHARLRPAFPAQVVV